MRALLAVIAILDLSATGAQAQRMDVHDPRADKPVAVKPSWSKPAAAASTFPLWKKPAAGSPVRNASARRKDGVEITISGPGPGANPTRPLSCWDRPGGCAVVPPAHACQPPLVWNPQSTSCTTAMRLKMSDR